MWKISKNTRGVSVATIFIAKSFCSPGKYTTSVMRPHVHSFLILLLILHEGYRPASLVSLALQIHHDVLLGDQRYTHTHTQNATTFECHRTLLRGWPRVGSRKRWPDISIYLYATPCITQSATPIYRLFTNVIFFFSSYFFSLISSNDSIYHYIILIVCSMQMRAKIKSSIMF